MSITVPRPPAPGITNEAPATLTAGRSRAIDVVRIGSMATVVVMHAMMVGASRSESGGLTVAPALLGESWFAPATWVLQVMPLFFLAGGFSALTAWRRMRARGAHWSELVAARVHRLAFPAAVMLGATVLALTAALLLGAEPSVVAQAGYRIGQPLWFLAVYLGVSALVPLLVYHHERHPVLLLGGLVAGVIAVDAVRSATGAEGSGFLNLTLVWPLCAVLGFWYHDGFASTWSRRRLCAGLAIPLAALFLLTVPGNYHPDMIVNLNPPTVALLLLAAAQFFALRLASPAIEAWAGRHARLVAGGNAHAMTIYLWHMPVALALVALQFAAGWAMPAAHSLGWWLSRPLWLATLAAAVVAAALLIARFQPLLPGAAHRPGEVREREGPATRDAGRRAVRAAVAAVAGVGAVLLAGLPGLLLGLGLMIFALTLIRGRR